MSHDIEPDWNPLDTAVLKDQRLAYDKMRARCPVACSDFMGWSLFKHADIVDVLADPATFSNKSGFPAIPNGLNPPAHGPYNTAVAAFFSEQNMALLEPRVRGIAIQLLETSCAIGNLEFTGAFIIPFVFKIQCAMLGWPDQQWEALADWVKGNEQVALNADMAAGKVLAECFAGQVKTNLDMHRAAGDFSDDATDALLRTEVNGKRLSDDEITAILRNWVAGHGTTADALGIVVMHLAQDRVLQEQLRQDMALIPAAIEEILRLDGPLVANRRTTTRDVEIQGRTIPADATVTLMWIAANRDPDVFKDPDTVKLDRATGASLVWGQGIHLCLGASMARMEMRTAVEELLKRTSSFTLDLPQPVRKTYPGNGFGSLQLDLEKA